jgi:hypothetical protein
VMAGGAVEVQHEISRKEPVRAHSASASAKKAHAGATAKPAAVHRIVLAVPDHTVRTSSVTPHTVTHKPAHQKLKKKAEKPVVVGTVKGTIERPADDPSIATGGARAPDAPASTATPVPTATPIAGQPTEPIADGPQASPEPATAQSGTPAGQAPATGSAPTPVPTPPAG